MSATSPELRRGVAHVFLAHPESLLSAVPNHEEWLSAGERERAERYRQLGDSARYRATRVLVRGVLSGLLDVPPSALDFVEGAHGRPSLHPRAQALDFNASRSRSWVGLLVTDGTPCGLDVEDVSRKADYLAIARAFAPEERALLEEVSAEERRRRFFALWTLKEATLKALGAGLTLSLGACAFRFEGKAPPRVTFASTVADDAEAWSFAQLAPDEGHLLAVALRNKEPVQVVLHGDAETCVAVSQAR
jgi:4'-phosphopantetheinyl transferase